MRRVVGLLLCVAALAGSVIGSAAQAAPRVEFQAHALWINETRNFPEPGTTTITQTRIHVDPGSRGYDVWLAVTVSEEANSGRGDRSLVSWEQGTTSVPSSALTVSPDLGAAEFRGSIPMSLIVRDCPPETPQDCVFTEVPSRNAAMTVSWTANEPLARDCFRGRVVEYRGAVATGTLNDVALGESQTGDNTIIYIQRNTMTRC